MVEFGKQLVESQRDDWKGNYIDYNRLKHVLKQVAPKKKKKKSNDGEEQDHDKQEKEEESSVVTTEKRKSDVWKPSLSSTRSLLDPNHTELYPIPPASLELAVLKMQKPDFRQNLDYEIEKTVLFVLTIQGNLASKLSSLCDEKRTLRERARNSIIVTTPTRLTLTNEDDIDPTSEFGEDENYDNSSPTSLEEFNRLDRRSLQEQWQELIVPLQEDMQLLFREYRAIGEQILQFIQFVELNVTAVRKILKKHDKLMPRHAQLSNDYLSSGGDPGRGGGSHGGGITHHHNASLSSGATASTVTNDDSSSHHLSQLYNYVGLSALIATLQRSFSELRQLECSLQDHNTLLQLWYQATAALQQKMAESNAEESKNLTIPNGSSDKKPNRHRRTASMPLQWDLVDQPGLQAKSYHARRPSSASLSLSMHRRSDPNLSLFQQGGLLQSAKSKPWTREPILDQIYAARTRLKQSTKYVEVVAAQALMMFDEEDEKEEEDILKRRNRREDDEMTTSQRISSFLNLASTFLYMTNYYIVAPTSGQYANRLGSSEAMAGIIIGMTPNAALIATVLYGWWSNYSYKPALLFAATCSLIGNIFYALALQYHSLTMVMIGRFLNGFGSARSINRRFIADTFSRSERTAASADFVTAGALGMAAGPAIAAFLGRYLRNPQAHGNDLVILGHEFDHVDDHVTLLWTVETSPGWIMCGMWSVFLISAIYMFEEPDRSHLFQTQLNCNEDDLPKAFEIAKNGEGATTNGDGEMRPLLSSEKEKTITNYNEETGPVGGAPPSPSKGSTDKKASIPLYKNVPVMMTLCIYFILKLVLEALLSSSATLTGHYFHWDSQHSGAFLAFLGLLMFPANMVVAKLSHKYEDRELIYITLVVMFFSVIGFIHYSLPTSSTPKDSYSVVQYITFGICIFLTTNCLEGPNMSLLSKTIPKEWAKGTFNSGFLATEAGTAARSVGDLIISAAAGFLGISHLLDATFVPLAVLVLITTLLMRKYYNQMTDDDDDDEEDNLSRRSSQSN